MKLLEQKIKFPAKLCILPYDYNQISIPYITKCTSANTMKEFIRIKNFIEEKIKTEIKYYMKGINPTKIIIHNKKNKQEALRVDITPEELSFTYKSGNHWAAIIVPSYIQYLNTYNKLSPNKPFFKN